MRIRGWKTHLNVGSIQLQCDVGWWDTWQTDLPASLHHTARSRRNKLPAAGQEWQFVPRWPRKPSGPEGRRTHSGPEHLYSGIQPLNTHISSCYILDHTQKHSRNNGIVKSYVLCALDQLLKVRVALFGTATVWQRSDKSIISKLQGSCRFGDVWRFGRHWQSTYLVHLMWGCVVIFVTFDLELYEVAGVLQALLHLAAIVTWVTGA